MVRKKNTFSPSCIAKLTYINSSTTYVLMSSMFFSKGKRRTVVSSIRQWCSGPSTFTNRLRSKGIVLHAEQTGFKCIQNGTSSIQCISHNGPPHLYILYVFSTISFVLLHFRLAASNKVCIFFFPFSDRSTH